MAEGKLSIDHADLLMRVNQPEVAHLFARDEGLLVDQIKMMRHPAAQRCMRYWRSLAEDEAGKEPSDRDRDGRHFNGVRTFRGRVVFDGMLDPIAGTRCSTSCSGSSGSMFAGRLGAGSRRARRSGDGGRSAADVRPTASRRARSRWLAGPPRMDPHAVMPRPLFTVLVGYDGFSKVCELGDGTVVSTAPVRPHLADADIERIVFDGAVTSDRRRRAATVLHRRAAAGHPGS